MRVQAAPPEHYPWIAERALLVIGPQFRALEAVDDAGGIHGMIGYDGWLENSVSMHIALEHPVAFRRLLRPSFGLVFDAPPAGAGRALALCTVLSSNKRSIELVRHVGFSEVFRGRNWWAPDVDLVFFEMKRAACRWLGAQKEGVRWAA